VEVLVLLAIVTNPGSSGNNSIFSTITSGGGGGANGGYLQVLIHGMQVDLVVEVVDLEDVLQEFRWFRKYTSSKSHHKEIMGQSNRSNSQVLVEVVAGGGAGGNASKVLVQMQTM
jgi:hypothetical protein